MPHVSPAGRLRTTDRGHGGSVCKWLPRVAICTGTFMADPGPRGRLADVLSSGYADGLRDVFLACEGRGSSG